MKKFILAAVALAALSTASFANQKTERDDHVDTRTNTASVYVDNSSSAALQNKGTALTPFERGLQNADDTETGR